VLGYPAHVPALVDLVPSSGISLGPLTIGFYGLGYVLGLALMVWVSQAEARRRGIDPGVVTSGIIVVAVCALAGARLYHVIDQWPLYADDPLRIVLPPYSGLGLYGGVLGAVVGIWIHLRGRGIPLSRGLDVVVPGTLVAQGIARWGNFFNQELYGPPTDLPWGIVIDCAHRVAPYPCALYPAGSTGFHPLFLYESLLDILGGLVALALARRGGRRLLDGDLASFWMIWYGSVRLALETFREGYNWTVAGVPTAMIVGAVLVAAGIGSATWRHARARAADAPAPP
jgi:phosphatidylglycerol:prolipoprotein diacylglycerol transferase